MTPIWVRVVGALGIAWNALGVVSYLGHVGVLAPMGPAVQMPALVTAAYAIGVFAAVIGCIGIVLSQRWSAAVLWISLAGLIVDWGWVLTQTSEGSLPLGATVLIVAFLLAVIAQAKVARRAG
jgi:hypothetical protein